MITGFWAWVLRVYGLGIQVLGLGYHHFCFRLDQGCLGFRVHFAKNAETGGTRGAPKKKVPEEGKVGRSPTPFTS